MTISINDAIGAPTFLEVIVVKAGTNYNILRELIDPSSVTTVAEALYRLRLNKASYIPFTRDYITGMLTEVLYETVVETKMTIVFVATALGSENEVNRVAQYLSVNPQILPGRMVWPNA